MEPRPWALSIDYGTSNTVSAIVEPRRAPRMIQFNGSVSLPSGVYFDQDSPDGRFWRVGRSAQQAGLDNPANFEVTPKRSIPVGDVFLGGRTFPVRELICATLTEVFREAWRQQDNMPPNLVLLTHPAAWPRTSLDVLVSAAHQALPRTPKPIPIMTTPEPVAAAWHASHSRKVPAQARIAVLDLGGGTCDIAVIDRSERNFQLASRPLGADPLGGEDFDIRLLEAVLDDLGQPELHAKLLVGTDHERSAYLELRRSCREAKEQLSDQVRTTVRVPIVRDFLPEGASVQISRPHRLEPLMLSAGEDRPGLDTAADLTRVGLVEAPRTSNPTFVFLVGGSSRIPLLGRLVQEHTGMVPLEHGDPGTAVAEGAASIAADALAGRRVPIARPDRPSVQTGSIVRPPTQPTPPRIRPVQPGNRPPVHTPPVQRGNRPPVHTPPVRTGNRPPVHTPPVQTGNRPPVHNGNRPPGSLNGPGSSPSLGTGLAIGVIIGLLILILLGVYVLFSQGVLSGQGQDSSGLTVAGSDAMFSWLPGLAQV